jgi:hypothetical protein
MTVDELISKLEEIKDKEVKVFVRDDDGEFGELSDITLEGNVGNNNLYLW